MNFNDLSKHDFSNYRQIINSYKENSFVNSLIHWKNGGKKQKKFGLAIARTRYIKSHFFCLKAIINTN